MPPLLEDPALCAEDMHMHIDSQCPFVNRGKPLGGARVPRPIPQEALLKAAPKVARDLVERRFSSSTLVRPSDASPIRRLRLTDARFGSVLGSGAYCTVRAFNDGRDDEREEKDVRYAIKSLSPSSFKDPRRYRDGLADLASETKFLSALDHPHLIRLHAVGGRDETPSRRDDDGDDKDNRDDEGDMYRPDYFIVIDRMRETLEFRCRRWAPEHAAASRPAEGRRRGKLALGRAVARRVVSPGSARDKKGVADRSNFFAERLRVLRDLASALEYLHSVDVIHRDVKPENVGFDTAGGGTLKLFDLGMARELRPVDRVRGDADAYKLTGQVGSVRFMSPEVARAEAYGKAADVYSFALVLWQVLALQRPFEGMDTSRHYSDVVTQGLRPKVKKTWTASLQNVLWRGWDENARSRPTMQTICVVLEEELTRYK